MSNVLPFKKPVIKNNSVAVQNSWRSKSARLMRGIVKSLWIFSVIIWPVIKCFMVLDLLFALLKMIFHSEPASTWYFIAHVVAATGIFWFVRIYNPESETINKDTGQ